METIELRESDKRRAVNLNRKNGYGLDSKQMMRLINNRVWIDRRRTERTSWIDRQGID